MGSVITPQVEQLKSILSDSALVVTPDSEKYEQSLARWSVAAQKPAV